MTHKGNKPLNVALYGMDERCYKTMIMFLQGPCKGAAVVVDALDADIDIIDADFATAKDIFDERRKNTPDRPIIAMSLEDLKLENTIFLKKPVSTEGMLAALEQSTALSRDENHSSPISHTIPTRVKAKPDKLKSTPEKKAASEVTAQSTVRDKNLKKPVDKEEQKKTAKHQTARQYNEGGFSAFIGILSDIDFDDREQALRASYDPKNYFQGYVKSAFKVANAKARVVQLNSSWKPLLIFPQTHEVWLDADEQQLRAFAGMFINNSSGTGMSLSPVDLNATQVKQSFDKFNSMDAFMWKLAIWTSKGRYPSGIDIERPVFLRRWPNFTRLIVTPHALRIAALLINEPRTLLNISDVLKIKPQYVFVFISSCYALGLVGQAVRRADQLIAPAEIKETKSGGLFRKILSKLRASK